MNNNETESLPRLLENVYQREKQEKLASAIIAIETLACLNVTIEGLPQKCQTLLRLVSRQSTEDGLDTVPLILSHSRNLSEELENDYEILKLQQKNREVQRRVDRNKVTIESLRSDLEDAKQGLHSGSVNPRNVQDMAKQLRQKVASYEESCEKAKIKFSKLSVPECLHPNSLDALVSSLAALKVEESQLKEKADDIILSQRLRDRLNTLRR